MSITPEQREQWKSIPGYLGLYEASTKGRIRSKYRNKRGWLVLSLFDDGVGYKVVGPSIKNKQKRKYVHVLVAMAHLGPIPKGHVVNHKNFKRDDKRIANLEIITKSADCRHALDAGRRSNNGAIGERNCKAKLTWRDVSFIRKSNAPTRQLTTRFGVHMTTIQRVRSFYSWQ